MIRIGASLVLGLLGGCISLNTTQDGPIDWETVYRSDSSQIVIAETIVLNDEASWSAIWNTRMTNRVAPPPAPKIDFSAKMLIGVGIGARPSGCYSVAIEKVHHYKGVVTVEYKEIRPGLRAICTANITHPVHVIAIPRASNAVHFIDLTIPLSKS